MRLIKGLQIALLLMLFFSCRKPYNPEVTTVNSNVLVVEGMINVGTDSTIFKLSRTQPIGDQTKNKPEVGAVVTVESDANEKFVLSEKTQGRYVSPGLNLPKTKKYRLSIKTARGVTYLSDFVEVKVTLPIDSVNFEAKPDGLQIYVNTHDNSNNSKYYKWDYVETWEFYSPFYSNLIWENGGIKQRDMINNNITRCWQNNSIQPITIASSAKLEKDVIYNSPLTFIKSDSEKIGNKYSILVKQYALTKEAYEFWENLKKNTESLGSVFDPQPSQISGNIRNVANAGEPVIGYISAGTYAEKRIFIRKSQLPPWPVPYPPYCLAPDTIRPADYKVTFEFGHNIPLEETQIEGWGLVILSGVPACVDCTLRGSNKQPAFWQ
jgi:hypothetical protein